MEIKRFVLGSYQTNCYALSGADFAAVIDPAFYEGELVNFVKENKGKKHKYILLTHCHIDHILGVNAVKDEWGCSVMASANAAKNLKNPNTNLSLMFLGKPFVIEPDVVLSNNQKINLGGQELTVLETPGHTNGSVCFLMDNVIFSGDTLFLGTIGRTDFATANYSEMLESLKLLANLKGDYIVYSGHGPKTTLNFERENNYYLRTV